MMVLAAGGAKWKTPHFCADEQLIKIKITHKEVDCSDVVVNTIGAFNHENERAYRSYKGPGLSAGVPRKLSREKH